MSQPTSTNPGVNSLLLAGLAGAACIGAAVLLRRARTTVERTQWNTFDRHSIIDESSDESFPASDPPSFTTAALPSFSY